MSKAKVQITPDAPPYIEQLTESAMTAITSGFTKSGGFQKPMVIDPINYINLLSLNINNFNYRRAG